MCSVAVASEKGHKYIQLQGKLGKQASFKNSKEFFISEMLKTMRWPNIENAKASQYWLMSYVIIGEKQKTCQASGREITKAPAMRFTNEELSLVKNLNQGINSTSKSC